MLASGRLRDSILIPLTPAQDRKSLRCSQLFSSTDHTTQTSGVKEERPWAVNIPV